MTYDIQKILVPVDLSEASLNALETAIEIAKKKNALLQIIHVEDNSLDFYQEHKNVSQYSETSNDILNALVNSIDKTHGIRPEIVFEKGSVVSSVLKKAHHGNSTWWYWELMGHPGTGMILSATPHTML